MVQQITAVCKTTMSLPHQAYQDSDDRFRNSVLMPPAAFHELGIDPFGYVEVRPKDNSENWSEAVILYTAPLLDCTELRVRQQFSSSFGRYIVGMRTNLMAIVDESIEPGSLVDIRPANNHPAETLFVRRSYADDRVGERCYIHSSKREEVGIREGGQLEVCYPETGGRVRLISWDLRERARNDIIGIDLHSKEILGIERDDEVTVRRPINHDPVASHMGKSRIARWVLPILVGIKEWILDKFVGHQTVTLRVLPGLSRDEHRNVVRMSTEMMEPLGVKSGDLVTLLWNGERCTVQCSNPPEDMEDQPLAIQVPSTERDRIGVSLHDGVKVRRDKGYVFKKNIALSMFGVLGVVVGIFSTVRALNLLNRLENVIGYKFSVLFLLALAGFISIIVVWIILYPERQRCAYRGGRESGIT